MPNTSQLMVVVRVICGVCKYQLYCGFDGKQLKEFFF
jgi:hypothetical protein